jgi:hypothetical protein
MIGFIDTLYTPLGTTGNYSAAANLYILQFTAANTSVLSLRITAFTIHFPATDFNTGAVTVSLNHTLQISQYYSTRKFFSSLPDFQSSTELALLLNHLLLPTPEL